MEKRVKVAVTGAAGQIGYALLFRIASGQMFGPDTEVELNLIELEVALSALKGVKMELDDCAFPLLKKISCTSQYEEGFKDVDWAILVGSIPRKAGMERKDLLEKNGGIFTSQGKAISDFASRDCKVFVVGNPCNTNCLIAMNNAPNILPENFFAMTRLDENRAKTQLAQKSGVDVTEVKKVTIWGNHSATQFPDFSNAVIKGQKTGEVIKDRAWLESDFITTVQKRGAEIIKARGFSSAASAANACVESIYMLTHDTALDETFSVCRSSQGEYGVDQGLIFSFPCRLEGGKLKVVENMIFDEFGQEKFQKTLEELREEQETVKSLGLI